MISRTVVVSRIAFALVLLSRSSLAQELQRVLRTNDRIAGEPVSRIESPAIGADRHWAALVQTSIGSQRTRRVAVDGAAILSVGDAFSPSGRVKELNNLAGSPGNLAVLVTLDQMQAPQPPVGRAVLRNGRVVLLSGAPLDAAGLAAGTLCRTIYAIGANSHDTVVALVDTPALDFALVRLEFDEQGVNVARTADLRTGQALPDGALVSSFDLVDQVAYAQAVNEAGNWAWRVTGNDGKERLVTRDQVLLRTGDASPVPGRSIVSLRSSRGPHHAHDVNDLGGHAAVVTLSGDAASDQLLIKNGAKLAQKGDFLPSLAPYMLLDILETSVRMSNSGDVYWVAIPDRTRVALMRNLDVVVQVITMFVGTDMLLGIDAQNFEISPDGRYVLGCMLLLTERLLLRIDLGAAELLRGCVPNVGTMSLSAGSVLTGQTIRLTLDGPVPFGSLARIQSSAGAATPGDPCGIRTPFGELLFDPNRRLATLTAGIFTGSPVHLDIGIPADPALVDVEIFAQGQFVSSPTSAVRTNGMRFVIGAGQ